MSEEKKTTISRRAVVAAFGPAVLATGAGAGILFSGPTTVTIPPITDIEISPNPLAPLFNAGPGTLFGTFLISGGTGATGAITTNTNFTISGIQILGSSTCSGNFPPGTQIFDITASDGFVSPLTKPFNATTPAGPSGINPTTGAFNYNIALGQQMYEVTNTIGGTPPDSYAIVSGFNNGSGPAYGTMNSSTGVISINSTGVAYYAANPGAGTLTGVISTTDHSGQTTNVTINLTVQDPAASTLIAGASRTLTKISAGTENSHFITRKFRQNWKIGDVANGTLPIPKVGGVTCNYSWGILKAWPDGPSGADDSVGGITYMVDIPTNLVSGTNQSLDWYTNGTAPANANRNLLADLTSLGLQNLQIEIVPNFGIGNGTTYICNISDGIANGRVFKPMDGSAGTSFIVVAQAKNLGVAHGHLHTRFYVDCLQDSTGGLYGIRMKPILHNGYADVSTPVKGFIMFSRAQFTNNGTLVDDPWANTFNPSGIGGQSPTFNFQWSHNTGTSPNFTGAVYQTTTAGVPNYTEGHGICAGSWQGSYAAFVSGAGLPPKLLANQPNPIFLTGNNYSNPYFLAGTTSITMSGDAAAATVIDSDAAGSGTCTIYPSLAYGTGFAFTPNNSAFPYFFAGTRAAEMDVRCIEAQAYLRSTGLIPPQSYIYSSTTNTQTAEPYVLGGSTSLVDQGMGTAGDRQEIGVITNMVALYLCKQDYGGEQTVRVLGLSELGFNFHLWNSTTDAIINGATATAHTGISQPPSGTGATFYYCIDQGTYPGNPQGLPGYPTTNLTGPLKENIGPHMPQHAYSAFILFGDPEYYDDVMMRGMRGCYTRQTVTQTATAADLHGGGVVPAKNYNVSSVIYQGCNIGGSQMRQDAWDFRDFLMAGAAAMSGGSYDGADHQSLFNEINFNTASAFNNWTLLQVGTYQHNAGLFSVNNSNEGANFQDCYMRYTACFGKMVYSPGAGAPIGPIGSALATFAALHYKYMTYVYDYMTTATADHGVTTNTLYPWSTFHYSLTATGPASPPAPIFGDDQLIGADEAMIISWTQTGSVLNIKAYNTFPADIYLGASGDQIKFSSNAPTGTSAWGTPYWLCNLVTLTSTTGTAQISSVPPSSVSPPFPQVVTFGNSGTFNGAEAPQSTCFNRPAHLVGSPASTSLYTMNSADAYITAAASGISGVSTGSTSLTTDFVNWVAGFGATGWPSGASLNAYPKFFTQDTY